VNIVSRKGMSRVRVETASSRSHQRLVTVRGEIGGISTIPLARFALVGPGDCLRIRNGGPARFIDLQAHGKDEWIPVDPCYRSEQKLRVGEQTFRLDFSEIETLDHLRSYERLESFHYKGRLLDEDPSDATGSTKGVGGRKAVLLASVFVGNRSRIIGYIELQMPLMMCKPRHDLFSLAFNHKRRSIKWSKWLGDGQRYVNLIVRVARVVVDPEFRGLGVSVALVEQAKRFASSRWTIGGQRPLFIEISAEMLRYVDFVSKAGLVFIGNTEGNLERIFKDLNSIEKGASGKSQIMSLQKRYHVAFSAYCKKTGKSFDEARTILAELITDANPREAMPSDEWLAFRPILRFPIPYHLAGLDQESSDYLEECLRTLKKSPSDGTQLKRNSRQKKPVSKSPVELQHSKLEIWIDHTLRLTPYVRLAMDSFGIDSARIRTRLVGPVDIDLVPGNVVLIAGSSGAGKSVLLEALSGAKAPSGLVVRGDRKPCSGLIAKLEPLPERTPLLQYFGTRYGAEMAFDTLCRVGLSEAMVFIKPFALLSMGQRYRAMLADLLLKRADVWLIDEFCSNVDPITAAIIAAQIRRLARRLGVIVVVAAANTAHFIDSLAPDIIYVVRTGGDVHRVSVKEFKNGFYEKGF
jgi:ABC-type transport system involved in cytochrome c biogenesis ATPase subunit/GNAT superfamily N-acetyltransferase